MLGMLANLLKILNSDTAPGQLSLGFAFALVVGLTPMLSLHNLLVLFLVMVIRVNLSAFFLATGFFTLMAYLIDPLAIQVGEAVLTEPSLQVFWTDLYQSEFWQATRFNHTLLMGSLVIALAAFIPVLLISRFIIVNYRNRLMAWVEKLKITKMIKASKFYKVYEKLAA